MYTNIINVAKQSIFTNIELLFLLLVKYDHISACAITNPFLIIFMFLLYLETKNPNQEKHFCCFLP